MSIDLNSPGSASDDLGLIAIAKADIAAWEVRRKERL